MIRRGRGQRRRGRRWRGLLPNEEENTHGQYIGKEREMLEQDHHRIQIPIHFVENETVEMISTNEILEKILSEACMPYVQ